MVGANYMGGRRNTARAKTKDVVGRAQKRHFGKQRLASALCTTREDRVHPKAPTLSTVLPEINLAHARSDACMRSAAPSSGQYVSGDRLYSSSLSTEVQSRNKPSKVLGALDTSDHTSMRAAIDRILRRPNLVGIETPSPTETARTERTTHVRGSTYSHSDAKDNQSNYPDERAKISMAKPYFKVQKQRSTSSEVEPTLSHALTGKEPRSPSDSSSLICDVTLPNPFDDSGYADAETNMSHPFYRQGEIERGRFHDSPQDVSLLPRSSPFSSSSQKSENTILNFDTSPLAPSRSGRSDSDPEENEGLINALSLWSSRSQLSRHPSCPSRHLSSREGSATIDGAQFILPCASPDVDPSETEQIRTTREDVNHVSPSTTDDSLRPFHASEYGYDVVQGPTHQGVFTDHDNASTCAPFNFLSDPDPWATIGKILKLPSPRPSAAQSVEINFTKGREGVGYVSPSRLNACNRASPGVTSLRSFADTSIEVDPIRDPEVVAITDQPVSMIEDVEIPDVDDRIASDSPRRFPPDTERHPNDLPEANPPNTTDIHRGASVTSVPNDTLVKHTRSSSPIAAAVGAIAMEPDEDVMYDGPCLFGDSDLEEDEE